MAFVSTPLPHLSTTSTSRAASQCASVAPVRAGSFAPRRSGINAASAAQRCGSAAGQAVPMCMSARLKTAIVTGASSSIGLHAAKELAGRGDYHVVMAVRNPGKAEAAAKAVGMPADSYTVVPLDLARLQSVREFVTAVGVAGVPPVAALVCNAATWHPRDKKPRFTEDGFDETVQVNHLGHFLLANLLLPQLKLNRGRCVFLATQTHNPDTLPGKVPPQADLGELEGLVGGFKTLPGTIDGKKFEPTKAYKDSKVCNILTMTEMNRRYGTDGVTFSAVFPGCIAQSELFREKRGWFRALFPLFQRYITKQLVPVEEAGRRVALVASDGRFGDSGRYWQWRGSYLQGMDKTTPVPIDPTEREAGKAEKLWELSAKLVNMGV
ncbi:NADPH:protochlorophyllide oxidoreductase [Chondrus crispus]|uniref:protochlorophyllide reductase n=1 Tax=Chondrus crispus TaxID=2769 RepID=S0F3U3_CHOCR|nr:NADPH:protochlorophyllide oxidoreductase [Chondrus crispus]CDF77433.1 NADPH:protochlorophyllide oxidoreductase [Chondrus crispus]|eukprot:XP_005712307.1 NADPH:protochlorophyllide oxidoreductase [Chondrus crispus]